MDAFFAEFPDLFDWRQPDGGCITLPRYLGKDGVETFCRRLVEEAGIVLLPAEPLCVVLDLDAGCTFPHRLRAQLRAGGISGDARLLRSNQ